MALNWVVDLVEKRDIYGFWRLNAPIGPFGTRDEYKSADQFVDRIAVHSERAFTARGASQAALKSFQRHFDEPLCYWDRTARGKGTLDEIKQALGRTGSQSKPPSDSERHQMSKEDEKSAPQGRPRPRVVQSDWRFEEEALVRAYEFLGSAPPATAVSLKIQFSASRPLIGDIYTQVFFYLRPYLHLCPDQKPFQPCSDGDVTAPFYVGLIAAGSGAGTEASPLVQGGFFKVGACAIEDEPDTVLRRAITILCDALKLSRGAKI
jgi:hypothetical protein